MLFRSLSSNETNTDYTTYNDINGNFSSVSSIKVIVEVSSYNPEASVQQSTNKPDLELEMWDNSSWVTIGTDRKSVV